MCKHMNASGHPPTHTHTHLSASSLFPLKLDQLPQCRRERALTAEFHWCGPERLERGGQWLSTPILPHITAPQDSWEVQEMPCPTAAQALQKGWGDTVVFRQDWQNTTCHAVHSQLRNMLTTSQVRSSWQKEGKMTYEQWWMWVSQCKKYLYLGTLV